MLKHTRYSEYANASWRFSWNNDEAILTLHNKGFNEAMKIAREWGWTPPKWYRPSTWNNRVFAQEMK